MKSYCGTVFYRDGFINEFSNDPAVIDAAYEEAKRLNQEVEEALVDAYVDGDGSYVEVADVFLRRRIIRLPNRT